MRHGAAAIFVKTPGFSPLKTRLAAGIGKDQALSFYRLACECLKGEMIRVKPQITAYWAIAETVGQVAKYWSDLDLIEQGAGGLGKKLSRVYSTLHKSDHDFVMLLGADAPQLQHQVLLTAASMLLDYDFVVGPATDGGFYLMAGRKDLPESVWLNIPYSNPRTCDELMLALRDFGSVGLLGPMSDVDHCDDLKRLYNELSLLSVKTQSQCVLMDWLAKHLRKS